MKRMVSLLLCISLLFGMNYITHAETKEFELRNGIRFGDTIDVIKEKETVLEYVDFSDTPLFEGFMFWGKITEYSGLCSFHLNDNDQLDDMRYSFMPTDRESAIGYQEELCKSLSSKYGEPISISTGSTHILTGSAYNNMERILSVYRILSPRNDVFDHKEWLVQSNNGYVKIDLTSFYYYDTNENNYYYWIFLSYHFFTTEEYNSALLENAQKILEEQKRIDNSL